MSATGYQGIRKRAGNPEALDKIPKVSFKEGFMIWLRSWKPSNLKASFKKEYARTTLNSKYVLQKIEDKISR